MDSDLAVVASIVIDLMAGIVGHDAAALRVIVDNVVKNFVALAGDVVGEDAVGAVVVHGVVTNDVVAGPKGRLPGINRELDARKTGVMAVVFLHGIRTRT